MHVCVSNMYFIFLNVQHNIQNLHDRIDIQTSLFSYLFFLHCVMKLQRFTYLSFINLNSHQIYEKQRYGSIYRDGTNAVCVNTAKLLEEVLRNDDKFPNRGDMSVWKEYRDMRGYGYGPFTE